jgi:hypothetical protein
MLLKFHKEPLLVTLVAASLTAVASCEVIDDRNDGSPISGGVDVRLEQVARILSEVPLSGNHLDEVYSAVCTSSENGYDEEYTMADLFEAPGRGVGEKTYGTKSDAGNYPTPLRDLIKTHVRSAVMTKSAGNGFTDPDAFLEALTTSDIQIYWPFSESWDGKTMPIITFDPEDGADANVGYRLVVRDDGVRYVEQVVVDETVAQAEPVWVVNRNSDADYTSLELLRREDPEWGTGGGDIIVNPGTRSRSSATKSLILRDFIMHRNYDTWFAGASEFFVKTGYLDNFTASTEAEMRLYSPMVTDFMIVVKRSQVGIPQPFNAILMTDWTDQVESCAFMITEDDGGTQTDWTAKTKVFVAGKSYGVEVTLPLNVRDDIVWRGQLMGSWIEKYSDVRTPFGDVDLTFEVVEF